jgi:hypothetical protein
MPSSNGTARFGLVSGLLAALACGIAAGEARAVPIPTQITYSTSAEPGLLKTAAGDVVFEFQPVTNGVAVPDSLVRLGTMLVHQGSPGKGFSFDNAILRFTFNLKAVNGEAVVDPGATVSFDNILSANVYEDGTLTGGLTTFHEVSGNAVLRGGGLNLSLEPVETAPLWNISSDRSVVAVDVYALLEGAPVPEPGAWLVFAAATALGVRRLGRGSRRA